jgi:hypothetical protein
MQTIAVISFSNLKNDPRVNRQIRFLSEDYKLVTIGLGDPEIHGVTYINGRGKIIKSYFNQAKSLLRLLLRLYDDYYFCKNDIIHCLNILQSIQFDLIIANDIDTLPLSLAIGKKVIFDAHEYSPLEFEERLLFRLIRKPFVTYLCNKYIPKVTRMITVCESISNVYHIDTNVEATIITNAPDYEELKPNLLTDRAKIRLIHHGGANPSRKIENMIDMMNYLDNRFELNLILTGNLTTYIDKLKTISANNPNIHFLTPVPMRDIVKYINQFDIGVYILEPNSFNNLYALPNKLFEFIQARLAIAIAPSPEMAKIVKEQDCGVVSEDFSPQSMAKSLMQLDIQKINYYKQRSHEAAYELSAQKNKEILLKLVESVLQG